MLRTTGVGQKIVELLKRRTVNCRTSGNSGTAPVKDIFCLNRTFLQWKREKNNKFKISSNERL